MKADRFLTGSDREWISRTTEQIFAKMEWVSEKNRDKIPYTTLEDGSWDDRSDQTPWGEDWGMGRSWWTNGFWGGLMWQLYHATGQERYREIAGISEEKLDDCFLQYYGLHHDVGFMWMPTSVADYRLTGNADSKRRALLAAQLLAGRFNPAGRFIRAWNEIPDADATGWAIIDCMFNISLLYWASEETGDPRYREIAQAHADTVMNSFIRPDGSSCHIVEFDPFTGRRVCSHAGQGYSHGGAWTRGQAWAIYGFAISWRHTGKQSYLDTAQKVADFFVGHMPESGIIPVDFCQPEVPALEDSCGAAAAASGLIELAECLMKNGDEQDQASAEKYMQAALCILHAIADTRACWDRSCDAIVLNCTAAYHSDDRHITMVYADYFFVEAMLKLADKGFFMW